MQEYERHEEAESDGNDGDGVNRKTLISWLFEGANCRCRAVIVHLQDFTSESIPQFIHHDRSGSDCQAIKLTG